MENIVSLIKTEPDAELVGCVERLLENVKDGTFNAVLMIAQRPDGGFWTRRAGKMSSLQIVGALAFAQHDEITSNPGMVKL